MQPPTRAVVLLTYGAGNIPSMRKDIKEALKRGSENGIILVNVSQCKKGGISISYEAG